MRLEAGEEVEALAYDLPRIAIVALVFPKFRDGRHYTSARLLRERYGYSGEVRAVGDVLREQAGFMVLTTARRPAILVELGYSTNPEDGRFLTTYASQKSMAFAIADAIVEYLLEYERKTHTAEPGGTR